MRYLRNALVVGIILAVAALAISSGADEPEIDNWCFEGQPWGDGRCNSEDPYINEYNWRMGWYMFHLTSGDIEYIDIPVAFRPSPRVLSAVIPGSRLEQVIDANGNCQLVLILPGSSYSGPGQQVEYTGPGNTFLGTTIPLGDACGLEIYGSNNNETIVGSGGDDIIHGMGGNDTLIGLGGDDQLNGGTGDDALYGRDGDDTMSGGMGNDELIGGNGNDGLLGGAEDDTLMGGSGNDTLIGSEGNDRGSGDEGDDTCNVEITLDSCD